MKPLFLVSFALLCITAMTSTVIAGAPIPGDGGLQIVFSEDGAGGTSVSATGTGQTNGDSGLNSPWLGFSGEMSDRDTIDPIAAPLANLLATAGEIALSDPIAFIWTGDVSSSPRTVVYDGFGIDQIFSQDILFFEAVVDMEAGIGPGGATMTVDDGTGSIPLPYSTFAGVHGMTFPSTDGFTFVFEESAAARAAALAKKSQLLRKIKKLKKKLKKAKRAGNIPKARKLKKNLKKLKKKLKNC